MTPTKRAKTDSIEELARFWDHHDLTDFQDEEQEVTAPVFKRSTAAAEPIRVRLTPAEATQVRRLAKSAGISQALLIQKWVRQQLKPRKKSAKFRN